MHESNRKLYDIVDQERKSSAALPDVRLIIWHFQGTKSPFKFEDNIIKNLNSVLYSVLYVLYLGSFPKTTFGGSKRKAQNTATTT